MAGSERLFMSSRDALALIQGNFVGSAVSAANFGSAFGPAAARRWAATTLVPR
jgi:hypothetical protein